MLLNDLIRMLGLDSSANGFVVVRRHAHSNGIQLRIRRERRGMTVDTLAAERLLAIYGVPVPDPPAEAEDWLTPYENESHEGES